MRAFFSLPILLSLLFLQSFSVAQVEYKLLKEWEIAKVWSGHPVGFSLLTHKDRQFIGFYDVDRVMTIGMRTLDADDWIFQKLDTKVGWDSHNYITMAVDSADVLHVSGNMHGVPLIYFRAEKPMDVASLKRAGMVGDKENKCTYPKFMTDKDGNLLFLYRDGVSGNGDWYVNQYDPAAKKWSRFLDKPLFDGEGDVNAYFHGPIQGPDGWFHLCWMWRETYLCETNHQVSYARSKNLRDWETSDGKPSPLPLTRKNSQVIDPVPPGGGALNPCQQIGFDNEGRVIVSYSKYDDKGYFQLMNARVEGGKFKIYQTSDWEYRWAFQGGGSIVGEVGFGAVEAHPNGTLTQIYRHIKHGNGNWLLDPKTLKPAGQAPRVKMPPGFGKRELTFPGIQGRGASDIGKAPEKNISYQMRWESMPTNRDRPREGEVPPPSTLRLYKLERVEK